MVQSRQPNSYRTTRNTVLILSVSFINLKGESPLGFCFCASWEIVKLGSHHSLLRFNDTHWVKLCFIQFSTRMADWLLLTFSTCLHNQLSSFIHSITRIKSTDVQCSSNRQ